MNRDIHLYRESIIEAGDSVKYHSGNKNSEINYTPLRISSSI